MSVQAIVWALESAPISKSSHLGTLIALANQADSDGEGAYPSHSTMAWETRKSPQSVRKDLREMEAEGIICRGDQRMTAHLPSDRRPVVWNLVMEKCRDMDKRPTKRPASGFTIGARVQKTKSCTYSD